MRNVLTIDNIEKKLRLADISPIWNSRLYEKGLPLLFSLTWFKWYFELKLASKCVVGEAYGFDSSYLIHCSECDNFGWRFMIYFTVRSKSKLDENAKSFVKHWLEKHSQSDNLTENGIMKKSSQILKWVK